MWVIDHSNGYVYVGEDRVGQLGASEILVLQCLMEDVGQLKEKDALLDYAWPQKVVAPNSLTVAIKNIRKVFSVKPCSLEIKTHHGRGYSLSGDVSEVSIVERLPEKGDGNLSVVVSNTDASIVVKQNESRKFNANSLLSWVRYIFLLIVLFFFIFVSALVWGYDKKLYCEEIVPNVKVCGTRVLNAKDKEQMKSGIDVHSKSLERRYSLYVYGYNYSPKNFVYYSVL
ncbi:MAG: winged helix-turn-helix domain-containing protein [Aeromonadaceae bacterium]